MIKINVDVNKNKKTLKIFYLNWNVCNKRFSIIQYVYHIMNKYVYLGYVSRDTSPIIGPTCWCDEFILLWTLNRKAKIFLRVEDFHFKKSSQVQLRGTKFRTDIRVIYESIQYQFNPSCPNPWRREKWRLS